MESPESARDLKAAISFLRWLRGWNQKELADAAGLDPSQISLYEQGKKIPSQKTLERLLSAVGVPFVLFDRLLALLEVVRSTVEAKSPDLELPEVADGAAEVVARAVATAVHTAIAQSLVVSPLFTDYRPRPVPPSEADRQEAEELWQRIAHRAPADRRLLVEEVRELQTWMVCERLCAESLKVAPVDAEMSRELAELALRAADLMPADETWRSRLKGWAWMHLAAAKKLAGDPSGAAEALWKAWQLWDAGAPGDPGLLDEERWRALEASLQGG